MRSAGRVLIQIVLAALGLAFVGGLVGGLIAQFATSYGFLKGVPYGMMITGVMVAFLTVQSGSPSQMARQGRWGYVGNYYGGNQALPQSPYQFCLGGLLTLGLGIAVLIFA